MEPDYAAIVRRYFDPDEIVLEGTDYDTIDEAIDYVAAKVRDFYEHCTDVLKTRPATIDYEDGTSRNWYAGNTLHWVPSGKFYACWTTNQTLLDEVMDSTFCSCMEELLPDVCFESGTGDGCDIIMNTWTPTGDE